ncbi:MAG TPA: MFS transporter [Lacisediminihabitans sp.]|uniref:MFS transporter n=1 Tax=Lacisediminihabitans sp. TaxID=2787631 RepID=UPI002EDA0568
MPNSRPLSLWAGRTMALLGILLVALNLRTAVAAISPIVPSIRVDIPLNSLALGIVGMVPPVAFALSGLFGASLAKRLGLERLLVLAIVAMVIGHLLRAIAPGFVVLLLGSVIALVGTGIGNVLLPPLVKRYFPDRIGLVSSLYLTVLSIGTALPAALSAPIADSSGWRSSLAIWSVVAFASLVPWAAVLLQHRRELAALDAEADEAPELEEPEAPLSRRIWRSRVAWTIAIVFALSSLHAYAAFAWLPQILIDIAGVPPVVAGNLLALFSIVGLPAALIMPVLTVRLRNVGWLIQSGIAAFIVGYLGLLFVPTVATWLWVVLIGAGPLLFPVCLTLINLRTRTHEGAVALSGFAQGIGYTIAAFGPLLVGLLHTVTGGWTAALVLLLATAIACIYTGARLNRVVYLEDELAAVPRGV